jgi:NADH dehydrogenase FAD-containing subunit
MSRKKVLVLGGNFGGLTAALAVSHELHGDVDDRPAVHRSGRRPVGGTDRR